MDEILSEFKKGIKEYFFTGLHSIGKTFTLLFFNSLNEYPHKKAYFNLETLKKSEEFFEIIIYESQNLFENENRWKETFNELRNKISDGKNYLSILYKLIELFVKKYIKENTEYIIILDQIKFKQIEDKEYNYINKIREVILKTNGVYLIGCCSLNFKGVKDILFYNLKKTEKDNENENNKIIPKLNYIKSSKLNGNNSDINTNKYLNLLGNSPRFKNIENKLNSKLVNLFIKKTKEKFYKSYALKHFDDFEKLKNIPVLKIFNQNSKFIQELEKIPFKYFVIDFEKKMFDFSCPIIKRVIEELLEKNELKKKF